MWWIRRQVVDRSYANRARVRLTSLFVNKVPPSIAKVGSSWHRPRCGVPNPRLPAFHTYSASIMVTCGLQRHPHSLMTPPQAESCMCARVMTTALPRKALESRWAVRRCAARHVGSLYPLVNRIYRLFGSAWLWRSTGGHWRQRSGEMQWSV